MSAPVRYELGVLVGGQFKQYANAVGQDYYEDQRSGGTQFDVPVGYEDSNQDAWRPDTSRPWPQWRNDRTGRIKCIDPNPAPPVTYLDVLAMKAAVRDFQVGPEAHEYMYRRAMVEIMRFCFPDRGGWAIYLEEPRGELNRGESKLATAVLKFVARPGGSLYSYDYCLVESRKKGGSWPAAVEQLGRHCAGTEVESKQVYAIVQVGEEMEFYKAKDGELTRMTDRLNFLDQVDEVMNMCRYLRMYPLTFFRPEV